MTRTYTAADFANAQFAKHPDGRLAHRINHQDGWSWAIESPDGERDRVTDSYMSDGGDDCHPDPGWVPVIPARTIHDRDAEALCTDTASYERDDYLDGFIQGFQQAGGVILEDPEPTNTERLTDLLKKAPIQSIDAWAEYLNDHGVTAPNVKGN